MKSVQFECVSPVTNEHSVFNLQGNLKAADHMRSPAKHIPVDAVAVHRRHLVSKVTSEERIELFRKFQEFTSLVHVIVVRRGFNSNQVRRVNVKNRMSNGLNVISCISFTLDHKRTASVATVRHHYLPNPLETFCTSAKVNGRCKVRCRWNVSRASP